MKRGVLGGGRQTRSFFSLVSSRLKLHLLGLDTGNRSMKHSDDHFIEQVLLDPAEATWAQHQLKERGKYRTLVFTHHQVVSAFVNSPKTDCNAGLLKQVLGSGSGGAIDAGGPKIAGWFNGHEHHFAVFRAEAVHAAFPDTARIGYFVCSGHGSVPENMVESTPPTPDGMDLCDPRFLPVVPDDVNTSAPPPRKGKSVEPMIKNGFVVVDVDDDDTPLKVTHYYINGSRDPTVTQKGPVISIG